MAVKPWQLGSKSLCLLQGRSTGGAEFAKPFNNPQLGLLSETCSDRVNLFGKMGETVWTIVSLRSPGWYKKCPCFLLGMPFYLFKWCLFPASPNSLCKNVKLWVCGGLDPGSQASLTKLPMTPQLVFTFWCEQNKWYHMLISDFFLLVQLGWSQASCSSCLQHLC